MSKTLLVTGSSGLIGSEVCSYFARELGYALHGDDTHPPPVFVGPQGAPRRHEPRLATPLHGYTPPEPRHRHHPAVTAATRARLAMCAADGPGPAARPRGGAYMLSLIHLPEPTRPY